MTPRLNPFVHGTDLLKSYLAFSNGVAKAGLAQSLVHLVQIRASQINGWNRLSIGFRLFDADASAVRSAA